MDIKEQWLSNNRVVNGWTFEYDKCGKMYQCRGDVMYDDEHDEMPDPSLMRAAYKLQDELKSEGISNAQASHSEKGWVEVNIY